MSRTLAHFAFLTMYLLGQTIGRTFCSPFSETFGRRTLYIVASLMFCVFSAIVGFVGLSLSPIYSAYITERCGWRWVFYSSTIASAISAALAFGVQESKADQLLQAKAKAICAEKDRTDIYATAESDGISVRAFVHKVAFPSGGFPLG